MDKIAVIEYIKSNIKTIFQPVHFLQLTRYFGQIDHFGRTKLTTLFVFNVQCFFSFSSTVLHS